MKKNIAFVLIGILMLVTAVACTCTLPFNLGSFTTESRPAAAPANSEPSPYSEAPELEPLQPKDWLDATNYPEIFKGEIGGVFYCGAKAEGALYPKGFKQIETWKKSSGDGNYLYADASNEYSVAAFCQGDKPQKHFAPKGVEWTTVLLKDDGFEEVDFPLK